MVKPTTLNFERESLEDVTGNETRLSSDNDNGDVFSNFITSLPPSLGRPFGLKNIWKM